MERKNCQSTVAGIWFYGLAGSGKTYASQFLSNRIPHSFVVDGDVVRRHVSVDLGYSEDDRKIQISRIFGIGNIVLENGMFPIMSSVTMTNGLLCACIDQMISVVRIERPFEQLKKVRNLYDGQKNVVGVNLVLPDLNTVSLVNDGTPKFDEALIDYAKSITA